MSEENQPLEESTGYSKYGITNIPKTTVTTALGQTKTCARLSYREWAFLTISVVNILSAVALTIYRLVKVANDNPSSPDFTFALLLLLNAAFCFFYTFHGLLRERIYELYVLIVAIIVVLVYCVVEYAFMNVNGRTTIKLVRLIAICVLAPPNIYLAWSVAQHFGYLQFRIVGASEFLQHLYQQASIFSCLLKFDVQVTASVVILVLKDGTNVGKFETIALAIGLPYSVLWNILGWFVLRKEWKYGAYAFAFLGLAKPAYYIVEVVKEYQRITDKKDDTDIIIYSLLAAVSLALLLWLIIMAELVAVYKNFGKGLKERAFDVIATENTSLITGQRIPRKNFI